MAGPGSGFSLRYLATFRAAVSIHLRSLPAAFGGRAQALLMGRRHRVICHWFESNLLHPDGAVAQLVEHSRFAPCPSAFRRVECRDDSTATLNHGGRMAHNDQDWEESKFEITSKRRKGFPSETQVKRGVRIVHGNKELSEKLGRNDLCPCGSGRRF